MVHIYRLLTSWSLALVLASYCHTHVSQTPHDLGDFQEFIRSKIKPLARERGITDETIARAFSENLNHDARVIKLDQDQPETRTAFRDYSEKRIHPRIHTARRKSKRHRRVLNTVQSKYGVSKAFILALWGLESNFGTHMGNFDVIRSLATLAYHGRRQVLFTNELIEALKILQQGRHRIKSLKGSWAGALGQCQFMPSAFNAHAVDSTNKGIKDIWTNPEDVFNSIANYLANSGWKTGQPWGVEVVLPPNFSKKRHTNLNLEKKKSHWIKLGIKPKDSRKYLADLPGALIIPDHKERAFIVYNNFKVILKWNRSICFALTVCLFADEISQKK